MPSPAGIRMGQVVDAAPTKDSGTTSTSSFSTSTSAARLKCPGALGITTSSQPRPISFASRVTRSFVAADSSGRMTDHAIHSKQSSSTSHLTTVLVFQRRAILTSFSVASSNWKTALLKRLTPESKRTLKSHSPILWV